MRSKACYLAILWFALLAVLCGSPTAMAQSEPGFETNSAAITSLIKSMANRFSRLKPHLDTGTIGLTHDGILALRDTTKIDVSTLLVLDELLIEENKDRSTLYREIARANGRPEWESDLRTTFGRRWISRMPQGWFHRDASGRWIQK